MIWLVQVLAWDGDPLVVALVQILREADETDDAELAIQVQDALRLAGVSDINERLDKASVC